MMIVDIQVAEIRLPELVEQACAGEEVVIARGSEPLVQLVPVSRPCPKRVFGSMKGRFTVPPEFFEPLPHDELRGWAMHD